MLLWSSKCCCEILNAVVKFNFYQDRELVRRNAKKLKGTKIGICEQLPEEIEKIRQTLYPKMRKAKAQGHQVRLVRDKLFINNIFDFISIV